jgi:hypothetical protein
MNHRIRIIASVLAFVAAVALIFGVASAAAAPDDTGPWSDPFLVTDIRPIPPE